MKKNKKKKTNKKVVKKITKEQINEFRRKAKIVKNTIIIFCGIVTIYHIGYVNGNRQLEVKAQEQVQTVVKEEKPVELAENELKVLYNSDVKTYMDYRKITDKTSRQYNYIHNSGMIEIAGGYLMSGEYIGVALGSYFGDIGNKFIFTLDTGKQIKAVKVEEKADEHTIDGYIQKWDKSVIEFVIDSTEFVPASNGLVFGGNFNNNEDFNGKIVKIEKVEDTK